MPTGIDWDIVRQPYEVCVRGKGSGAAASQVMASADDFEIGAEEVELADDALNIFGCDFAADCAFLDGGNHDLTRYFPGRVSAKMIEGLSGLHSPADLARLLSDSNWPEYQCVVISMRVVNIHLITGKRRSRFLSSHWHSEE